MNGRIARIFSALTSFSNDSRCFHAMMSATSRANSARSRLELRSTSYRAITPFACARSTWTPITSNARWSSLTSIVPERLTSTYWKAPFSFSEKKKSIVESACCLAITSCTSRTNSASSSRTPRDESYRVIQSLTALSSTFFTPIWSSAGRSSRRSIVPELSTSYVAKAARTRSIGSEVAGSSASAASDRTSRRSTGCLRISSANPSRSSAFDLRSGAPPTSYRAISVRTSSASTLRPSFSRVGRSSFMSIAASFDASWCANIWRTRSAPAFGNSWRCWYEIRSRTRSEYSVRSNDGASCWSYRCRIAEAPACFTPIESSARASSAASIVPDLSVSKRSNACLYDSGARAASARSVCCAATRSRVSFANSSALILPCARLPSASPYLAIAARTWSVSPGTPIASSARESSRPSMNPERSVSNRLKATAHRSTVVRVAAVCSS